MCGIIKRTYSHALHNVVLLNDGPHIQRWSHKILALRLPQTGAKYSQRQRNLRCEFCRGLERTWRQVAVPTLARKNRAGVCKTAAINSLSLLARFFVAVAAIVQVSHYNSESSRQLVIRMSFVGRLRRVGPDRFHSCFLFSHTSESACMG